MGSELTEAEEDNVVSKIGAVIPREGTQTCSNWSLETFPPQI